MNPTHWQTKNQEKLSEVPGWFARCDMDMATKPVGANASGTAVCASRESAEALQ